VTTTRAPTTGRHAPAAAGRTALLVFVAGAALMALEIAGSRVLAPYFGSSIFVWGSLIGVFLTAMAGGAALGGGLSRRAPRPAVLGAFVALAGLLVVSLPAWADALCAALAAPGLALGPRAGPLVASFVLFAPASVLLAAPSPYAVRLLAREIAGVGHLAGRLYAISTAGSIAGTLATTFVLVPAFGTTAILRGLGVLLLGAALLALPRHAGLAALAVAAALGAWSVTAEPPPRLHGRPGERFEIVDERESVYHRLLVTRAASRSAGEAPLWRVGLWFDRDLQGAVYECRDPRVPRGVEHWSAMPYTDLLVLARVVVPHPRRVLFLGAGGGVGPMAYRRQLPEAEIDVVEIDPEVLRLAHEHLHFELDAAMREHVRDGRAFLRGAAGRRWDVIVVDVFSAAGRPPFHMMTREFFEEVARHLRPGGAVVTVLDGPLAGPGGRLFASQYATQREVFAHVQLFPHYTFDEPWDRADWPARRWSARRDAVLVATDASPAPTRAQVVERADALWAHVDEPGRSYWNTEAFFVPAHARNVVTAAELEAMWATRAGPIDFEGAIVLTDDHAPVDTLAGP